jgi:hypothetical protein
MSRRPGWALVAASALIACGGEGADAADEAAVVVRDSAGVQIVESRLGPPIAAPWALGAAPILGIGQTAGEDPYLLSRVVGALRLADGRIVIGDGGTGQLRFYDSAGVFLSQTGGVGEGPGEFEYMRSLERCRPDGFIAFDIDWAMNAYTEEGAFVEKRQMLVPEGITPYNLACDPAARVVMIGWGRGASPGPPPIGFHTTRDRLVLAAPDGSVATDFGEWLVSERIGTQFGSRPHPFGRATLFGLYGDQLYVGTGERMEVQVYGLDGTLQRVLRVPAPPLDVNDSLKTAYLESELAATPEPRQAALRTSIAEWEWPPTRPAYSELRVDPLGVVWLKEFAVTRTQPERWMLLDPERGYLGELELPARHTLLTIDADALLLLAKDELDVERVVAYALERGVP